jgi:hypothetical protein
MQKPSAPLYCRVLHGERFVSSLAKAPFQFRAGKNETGIQAQRKLPGVREGCEAAEVFQHRGKVLLRKTQHKLDSDGYAVGTQFFDARKNCFSVVIPV